MLSETVGALPLKVFRDLGEGDRVSARTHRAWRMLHDQPNPITPAHRFWSTVTAHLLLYGNAFIEKIRNDLNLVDELWLLAPASTIVEWDGNLRKKRFVQESPSGRKIWDEDQVLHITALSFDGLLGTSPVSECKDSLGTAIARNEFEGSFYKRGATLSGLVEHPARIGQDAVTNLRETFTEIYGGSASAHKVGVLEEGATFKPMTMPLNELDFVEAQKLTRSEVATMFGIPASFLNAETGDSLTYATVESNEIQLAQFGVTPWTNTIAKSLAADSGIFPQGVFYPEFILEGLMRGDAQARSAYYTTLFNLRDDEGRRGIEIDEIRAKENLPPGTKRAMPVMRTVLAPSPEPAAVTVPVNGSG